MLNTLHFLLRNFQVPFGVGKIHYKKRREKKQVIFHVNQKIIKFFKKYKAKDE
jgi:hypothetical protein